MSSPTNAKDQLFTPHCPHCGFAMAQLQLRHDPGTEGLDQVFECRSCGVMTMPDSPATSVSPPVPAR